MSTQDRIRLVRELMQEGRTLESFAAEVLGIEAGRFFLILLLAFGDSGQEPSLFVMRERLALPPEPRRGTKVTVRASALFTGIDHDELNGFAWMWSLDFLDEFVGFLKAWPAIGGIGRYQGWALWDHRESRSVPGLGLALRLLIPGWPRDPITWAIAIDRDRADRERITRLHGRDSEEIVRQLEAERRLADELGLPPGTRRPYS